MVKSVGLAAVLCLSVPAHAQVVFKCVSARGAVTYQSHGCPSDTTARDVYDARPDRAADAAAASQRAQQYQARSSTSSQSIHSTPGASNAHQTERDRAKLACANAKANREETLRIVGIRRTFNLLRSLDEQVYEACKTL